VKNRDSVRFGYRVPFEIEWLRIGVAFLRACRDFCLHLSRQRIYRTHFRFGCGRECGHSKSHLAGKQQGCDGIFQLIPEFLFSSLLRYDSFPFSSM
jgi:hypothetical protein